MTKIVGDIWVEKSIFIPCADWICWEFLANFWLVLSAGITGIALWTMGLWPDPVLPCRGNFRFNRKFREFSKFPVQPEILAILRVKILIIWEPSGLIWEPSEHHFTWPAAMFSSLNYQPWPELTVWMWAKSASKHHQNANDFGHYFRDLAGTWNQDIALIWSGKTTCERNTKNTTHYIRIAFLGAITAGTREREYSGNR